MKPLEVAEFVFVKRLGSIYEGIKILNEYKVRTLPEHNEEVARRLNKKAENKIQPATLA